ncbi:hypothetical protein PDIDSM_3150 [Penicillium digitatum]|nr:hypothetical protein PDIDSM_3150 [Penicillium digitatum]
MVSTTINFSGLMCLALALGPAVVLSAPQLPALPFPDIINHGPETTNQGPDNSETSAGSGVNIGIPGGPYVNVGAGFLGSHRGPCGPGSGDDQGAGARVDVATREATLALNLPLLLSCLLLPLPTLPRLLLCTPPLPTLPRLLLCILPLPTVCQHTTTEPSPGCCCATTTANPPPVVAVHTTTANPPPVVAVHTTTANPPPVVVVPIATVNLPTEIVTPPVETAHPPTWSEIPTILPPTFTTPISGPLTTVPAVWAPLQSSVPLIHPAVPTASALPSAVPSVPVVSVFNAGSSLAPGIFLAVALPIILAFLQ